jgi:hypothetical protein
MVKSGKGGDENLKRFFLCGLKGKYVLKIKTDHLGKDLYSRTTI